ncbi:ABC transporter permease [Mesorhizobium sp. M1C.F.Ca.ET.193.01.1.1]|nr:ABC transporter permease [Mesorhizobium sp. M1C.F.Ca.ET.210.01.1.1]TGQ64866.1 ABC transporter permease [Mesorhizobium sp. M1C.F.Ca.ET.212.01.1.1]TGQ98647.1 ABC transporter permease [Mesorhizobium sp. M1C.F.Ca.ET.204.01.1.1]TGR18884.1 ABC transporter permease [Mesorhizobium sp. M1C.F.Ca.ET.196.01.1.1]TGR41476.1 ABC transporter permease [Mesorhizobium sp. M1C.F.Ca.ET.195.01.1.1]TGR61092.1 ABC transporter permease [Mesorhizobium sp. M1C.F.Ca.ET.192.01.1.1]TGR74229.1 ABC transporter permease [
MRQPQPFSRSLRLKGRPRARSMRSYAPAASWILIAPAMAILAIGFLYPLLRLIMLSLSAGPSATYGRLLREPLYATVLASSVVTAVSVTFACTVLGYPVALAMARLRKRAAALTTACVLIPLWTSVLIRSYAWIVLLQRNGLINSVLISEGLTQGPIKLLYTQGAVIVAMTHVLLPFAILPIFSTLRAVPNDYVRAAHSLGAGKIKAFFLVTLPLSLPGVFAGAILCFVLALGFYITPALVGGPESMMMASLIGQQTTVLLDWPFAAALSTVLLAITLLIVVAFRKSLSFSKGLSSVY